MVLTLDNYPPPYTTVVLLSIGIFAMILNSFAVYIIIFQSPATINSYKYILLGILVFAFSTDVALTVLLVPVALPTSMKGTNGVQFIGIWSKLFPDTACIQGIFGVSSLHASISMSVSGFLYREYILLNLNESSYSKNFRYFQLFSLVITTFLIVPFGVYMFYTPNDSEFTREIMSTALVIPGGSVFLFLGANHWVTYLPILYMAYLTFLVICMVRTIKRINNFLAERKTSLSSSTVRMHKMLLRALVCQTAIPSLFLLTPIFFVLCTALKSRFIGEVELELRMYAYSSMAYFVAFYSTAHVTSMLYFTLPYKDFCWKLFGISSRGNGISPSLATDTRMSSSHLI